MSGYLLLSHGPTYKYWSNMLIGKVLNMIAYAIRIPHTKPGALFEPELAAMGVKIYTQGMIPAKQPQIKARQSTFLIPAPRLLAFISSNK